MGNRVMNEYEEMMIERDEAWEKGHAEGLAEGRMEMAMDSKSVELNLYLSIQCQEEIQKACHSF